jgi:hypothetical protein
MKKLTCLFYLGVPVILTAATPPSLTIYNQNFAVVRDTVPLDLKAGLNEVRFLGATAHVEPDSVMLRDPAGKHAFQILEQNYRNDPLSQELLLSLHEGKTIDFEVLRTKDNTQIRELIPGKIIRSGYVPHGSSAYARYGQQYMYSQLAYASPQGAGTPIVEVDGKIRFGLPGQPIFPGLGDDTVLKPALTWQLNAEKSGTFDAEVGYVSGGFTWKADYNLVAPEKGDTVDMLGWVTMDNQSGKTFENAKIKLMAGDVNKIKRPNENELYFAGRSPRAAYSASMLAVAEKTFDEFHLYTLARPATLRDRETKQVEFVRASKIAASTFYIYDGVKIGQQYQGYSYGNIRQDRDYGTECNPKVWVMREFVNDEKNHLGMPLPKGKLRFYRRNDDGQLEFTGEDMIDHTPRNETVRVSMGNAFDLVGERKRTDFKMDSGDKWLDETFEIKLRNRKKEPVEIRVVEHLYRWTNWTISEKSNAFLKADAQTIEFRVQVQPDQEQTISYKVHYSW